MKNDGGPAFPHQWFDQKGFVTIERRVDGMSLRDWFAGQVVAGYMAGAGHNADMSMPDLAEHVYQMADAMLAEREKGND